MPEGFSGQLAIGIGCWIAAAIYLAAVLAAQARPGEQPSMGEAIQRLGRSSGITKTIHAAVFFGLLAVGFRLCYGVLNLPADPAVPTATLPAPPPETPAESPAAESLAAESRSPSEEPVAGPWDAVVAWATILPPAILLLALGRAWYRAIRMNGLLVAYAEPFRQSLVPPLTFDRIQDLYLLAGRGDMGLALVIAGLFFWIPLILLFLGISSWVGAIAGALCAFAISLWALLPPTVLVLGNSNLAAFELFRTVKRAARPFRCVHMLEFSADLKSSPGRADLRLHTLTSSFRGADDGQWRDTIEELMRMASLIVIDTRILTGPIREELQRLESTSAGRKTVYYTGGSVEPSIAVPPERAVATLDELARHVRTLLGSERKLAHLHFGASLAAAAEAAD